MNSKMEDNIEQGIRNSIKKKYEIKIEKNAIKAENAREKRRRERLEKLEFSTQTSEVNLDKTDFDNDLTVKGIINKNST